MITIENLHSSVAEKEILHGVNLTIEAGEIHVLMGKNGTGKSTLANVLAGKPAYEISQGSVRFAGNDLLAMEPFERAHAGLFLAFQYPVELPGVNVAQFLRTSINATRHAHGIAELDAVTFLKKAREKMAQLKMDENILKRNVNEGFSGGEKKRFETLQMALLEPKFAILDETDSGLDVDALKIVAEGVNALHDGKRAFLIITHYERLLELVHPTHVHVLEGGKIIKSGGKELADKIAADGFAGVAA